MHWWYDQLILLELIVVINCLSQLALRVRFHTFLVADQSGILEFVYNDVRNLTHLLYIILAWQATLLKYEVDDLILLSLLAIEEARRGTILLTPEHEAREPRHVGVEHLRVAPRALLLVHLHAHEAGLIALRPVPCHALLRWDHQDLVLAILLNHMQCILRVIDNDEPGRDRQDLGEQLLRLIHTDEADIGTEFQELLVPCERE